MWFDISDSHKLGKVKWEDVCKPKKVGGLGLRNLLVWNQVAIGKIIWRISSMKDSMWVRWVHGVYTKGGNWGIFNAPPTRSWVIKKLFSIRDSLWCWIDQHHYFIREVYLGILNLDSKVQWRNLVWNRYSIPKTSLICWLMALGKLSTKEKLYVQLLVRLMLIYFTD